MAAPPAARYAYVIPSLSETIPGLPPLGNLGVNRAIVADTLIDVSSLANATLVAENLRATLGKLLI